MNNVTLVGNLTRDPELKTIGANNTSLAEFDLAVSRDYKVDGQPDTDFFKIKVWGKPAENCAKYLKKGKKAGIVGQIQNRAWDKPDGTKGYITEIIASKVTFLSPSDGNKAPDPVPPTDMTPVDDKDLPF